MPRENVEPIQFHIPPESKELIKQLAKDGGFQSVADYIRSLIKADANQRGISVNLEVQYGGRRNRAEDNG